MSLTPAKKPPRAERIMLLQRLLSGMLEFMSQAIKTVVSIEHLRNVRKLKVLGFCKLQRDIHQLNCEEPEQYLHQISQAHAHPEVPFLVNLAEC